MAFPEETILEIKRIFDLNYSKSEFEFFETIENKIISIDEKTISINHHFELSLSECKKILSFSNEKIKTFFEILQDRNMDDITSMTSIIKEVEKVDEFKDRLYKAKHKTTSDLQLFHGDSRKHLKYVDDNCVDMVLTDPPYGIDFVPSRSKEDGATWEEKESADYYFQLFDDVCKEMVRICKPDAHIYIFTGWKAIDTFKQTIEKYFDISNILVWVKNNHSLVDFSKRYSLKYENIFFCKMKGNNERSLTNNISHDILEFARVNKPIHSCQKPVDLLEYLIKNSTVENEVVMDPFCGSHATGVAALNLNRKFIGCEIEDKFHNYGKEKLENILKGK